MDWKFIPNGLMLVSLVLSSFSQAAVIELVNGDILNADVVSQSAPDIVLHHEVLGEIVLSSTQIMRIDGVELGASLEAIVETSEPEAIEGGLFNLGILSGWERSVGAGFNGSQGNSDTMAIYGVFDANYADSLKRWKLEAIFDSIESDGDRIKNQFYTGVNRDWLQPDSKWFYFAGAKYDWDEFKDWDHRLTGLLGGGYQFVGLENKSILGRFGFAGKQNFGGGESGFTPELVVGLDVDWVLTDRQSLAFSTDFFTGISDLSEFRNISRFAWKLLLEDEWDMSLQIGFDNEYESNVAADIKQNDFKYRAALVWGL